jgi:glycosyltransferase involved in cell wall biosynthesis
MTTPDPNRRRKIAWFTPFGVKSAIGRVGAIICQRLKNRADVTVFASTWDGTPSEWCDGIDVVRFTAPQAERIAAQLAEYDDVVYNLGNHFPYHHAIFEVQKLRPGVVVLHDLVVHHFFAGYLSSGDWSLEDYARHVQYAHGEPGVERLKKYLTGEIPEFMNSFEVLACNMAAVAVRPSIGVVVHTQFSKNALCDVGLPIRKIDFPEPWFDWERGAKASPPTVEPKIDGESNRMRLLTFGVVNPNKVVHEVIAAIGRSNLRELVEYSVVGPLDDVSYRERLERLIAERRLESTVTLHGYQDDRFLANEVERADVICNLRNPHLGEGSWSLLESLFAGKPTVVWRHGYYDEFPETVVAKVDGPESLERRLLELATDRRARSALGVNARRHAEDRFSTERYVDSLVEFLDQCQYDRPALELVDRYAAKLAEMRWTPTVEPLDAIVVEEIAAFCGLEAK